MAKLTVVTPDKWMHTAPLPPGKWLFCQAAPGSGWWDADDTLMTLPGAVRTGRTPMHRVWVAVPEYGWAALQKVRAESNRRTWVRGVVER